MNHLTDLKDTIDCEPDTFICSFPGKEDIFIPHKYEILKIVWRTAHGILMIAYDIYDKITVLITVNSLEMNVCTKENYLLYNDTLSECLLLTYLQTNNLCVKLISEQETRDWHIFITQYPEIGCLNTYILRYKGLCNEFELFTKWTIQLVNGIYDLHINKNIAHFDINPENIFITKKEDLKIVDYAHATFISSDDYNPLIINLQTELEDSKFICKVKNKNFYPGIPSYISPELLIGDEFDAYANDVWSLGCVLFFILTGRILFKIPSSSSKIFMYIYTGEWIQDKAIKLPWLVNIFKAYEPLFIIIDKMLKPESDRINIKEVKKLLFNQINS